MVRRFGRLVMTAVVVTGLLAASPAAAGEAEDALRATTFTPDDFLAAFDDAELTGLAEIGPPPSITGNSEVERPHPRDR